MKKKLKDLIRQDFLNWSGGFPPESEDHITVYIDYASPLFTRPNALRDFLRQWMDLQDGYSR